MVEVEPLNQPNIGEYLPTNGPIAIRTQILRTVYITHTEDIARASRSDTQGHFTRQESKQINLIHRNKHKETTKMKRQKSNPQMKEKEKSPKKELSEIEASNLSDVEFKVMVIKMLKELSEKYRNLVGPTAA